MQRLRSLVVVASAFFLCAAPRVAFADEPRLVRLSDALDRAAAGGPGVAVAGASAPALGAAKDAARQGLPAPPTLTLAAGPRIGSAGTSLDLQVGIYVPIAVRDLSGARARSVETMRQGSRADIERAKSDAALRAALAWGHALEARQILAVRQTTLERAEELLTLAKRRVTSGVARPSEVAMASGDRAFASAAVLDAEGAHVEAMVELRVAIGAAPGETLDVEGDFAAEVPEAHARARAWAAENLAHNPTLLAARAKANAARAEVVLARASSGPVVSVGAMFAREGDGSSIVLGALSLPVPILDPAAFDRARADAYARTVEADGARVQAELSARLSLAAHDMEHTRELRARLEREAVPMLREALRLSLAEVSAGTSDVGPALLARQRLLVAEEAVTHACAEVLRADLHFLHLTGRILPEARR